MEYKVAPKEIPEEWRGRCSGDGHKTYVDSDGIRRYANNNELVSESPYRPCAKCSEFPTDDGDDYCIANLGKVMNACCGHGTNKGYIQFDNGITIRGFFEIEKGKKHWDMEYEIRSRKEILDKINELQKINNSEQYRETLEVLKWVMRME